MLFQLPITPTERQQTIIFIIVILMLQITGIYAYFSASWSQGTWYIYGTSNILLGLFIYAYQTGMKYTIAVATLLIQLLTLSNFLLNINILKDNPQMTLLINIGGAIEGWNLVWTLYMMSKVAVF